MWRVKIHPAAKRDFNRLDPYLIDQLKDALRLLVQEPDPRHPRNRRLNVCYSYPHGAGTCLRFKIVGERWRVVFRMIVLDGGGYALVLDHDETLPNDACIQIVYAGERCNATYNVYVANRMERV